jgi:hypothetical protein
VDACYGKSMLARPEEVPNHMMNRWIKSIFQYIFELTRAPKERLTIAESRSPEMVLTGAEDEEERPRLPTYLPWFLFPIAPLSCALVRQWFLRRRHRKTFLESVRALSNVRLIEFRRFKRTGLARSRAAIPGRRRMMQIVHREDVLCWVSPPIKSWNSFIDLYSPRRCRRDWSRKGTVMLFKRERPVNEPISWWSGS